MPGAVSGMTDRSDLIRGFLARGDWAEARRHPLSGDASFRRYERLIGGPRPAMLMDAPPPTEDVRPFMNVSNHLSEMGFSAPEILDADTDAGLLIIEDFGDATYTRELAGGADEQALYELAVDVLVDLHRRPDAIQIDRPAYDTNTFLEEARLLVDWYLPALRGRATPDADRATYEEIWRAVLPVTDDLPTTLVLRDYHVDNLMRLKDRSGLAGCGLLDFQDALVGPTAYDLVSLLEDARRDISGDLRETLWARYNAAFPDLDPEAFAAAAAVLAAQRNCKIIGIFTRLLVRDGKPVYLRHIPRVWRLLENDLAHPVLGPLREWMDRVIPAADRHIPDQD